jgi:hypothetical protein
MQTSQYDTRSSPRMESHFLDAERQGRSAPDHRCLTLTRGPAGSSMVRTYPCSPVVESNGRLSAPGRNYGDVVQVCVQRACELAPLYLSPSSRRRLRSRILILRARAGPDRVAAGPVPCVIRPHRRRRPVDGARQNAGGFPEHQARGVLGVCSHQSVRDRPG